MGLVLEGGGMRGAYTSGVLDAFMDEDIKFSYVIGVSAGANNGTSYISEQRGRNKKVFVDMVKDKRYSGVPNLLKVGSYFNMDFIFNEIPNKIIPFDYETFRDSPVIFKVGVTDCETGEITYFSHKDYEPLYFAQKVLRASSSLPIISAPVEIKGRKYFDGGLVDPLPIEKAMEDGNMYNVLILTRDKNYRKTPEKSVEFISKMALRKYPKIIEAMKNRYRRYNYCVEKIIDLEKKGNVFVFRPENELIVDRYERNTTRLYNVYKQGYKETMKKMNSFKEWAQVLKR